MKITRTSITSGITRTRDIDVTEKQMEAYTSGSMNIQNAMPNLSASDREFILTGITDGEWDDIFPKDEEYGDYDDDEPAF